MFNKCLLKMINDLLSHKPIFKNPKRFFSLKYFKKEFFFFFYLFIFNLFLICYLKSKKAFFF
jgi:hypothetical protein